MNNLLATESPDWSAVEAVAERVYDASRTLYQLNSRIQLVGPEGIVQCSDEMWVAVRQFHDELVKIWDSRTVPIHQDFETGLWARIGEFERAKRELATHLRSVLERPEV
ncbi:hypothetical protein ACH4S9_46755 [Streptomyces sp. NPDC021225]|uniref:hypothetical protein n=1 Tax=Streptomyces sp. NPDC021225 TaxID=3365121 RepID=UPI0037B51F59